jgi:spermidine synthase
VKPWTTLEHATVPGGGGLELREHDGEYVIRADGYDLMISRAHDSEDAMMALACPRPRPGARVLVGGLGMGYTLRGALTLLPEKASATVVELVPEVIEWNRGVLGPLAGRPLDDPRTKLVCGDVRDAIKAGRADFDAMLLDIDNGPEPTARREPWLYTAAGLAAIERALRPGGAVAVWSVDDSLPFERRLRAAGLASSSHAVHGHHGRGTRFVIFVGRKR